MIGPCAFCGGASAFRLCRACDVPETLAFEQRARASERAKVAEEIAKAIETKADASRGEEQLCYEAGLHHGAAIARKHAKRGES